MSTKKLQIMGSFPEPEVYAAEESVDISVEIINADTLGGVLAEDYVTKDELTLHTSNQQNPHEVTADQVGAVSLTLLWENSSPTSYFAAQTLALDLSEYDAVDIEWSAGEHYTTLRHWSRVRIGCDHEVSIAYNTLSSENPTYTLVRWVGVSTTGLNFSRGEMHYWNTTSKYDHDGRAIPFRIYGVKGVA